jgi:hypothetical protein
MPWSRDQLLATLEHRGGGCSASGCGCQEVPETLLQAFQNRERWLAGVEGRGPRIRWQPIWPNGEPPRTLQTRSQRPDHAALRNRIKRLIDQSLNRGETVEQAPEERRPLTFEESELLNRIARHEAAHAAVVLHFNGQVSEATATLTGGHVWHGELPRHLQHHVAAAGFVANNADGPFMADDLSSVDREELITSRRQELLAEAPIWGQSRIGDMDDGEILATCFHAEYTREILEQRGRFVDHLAALLVERGRLDGSMIHALWGSYEDQ